MIEELSNKSILEIESYETYIEFFDYKDGVFEAIVFWKSHPKYDIIDGASNLDFDI